MTDDPESRLAWLAHALDEALRLGVISPAQLLAHATPEVLAERLPRDLMVKVFASAFATGKLTPEGILAVAPPQTLVRYVAPSILWNAVSASAERNQMASPAAVPKGQTPVRAWLTSALASALEQDVLTAADVMRHLPPAAWVGEVPREVVSGILGMGLAQPVFDAALVLKHLRPAVIGEHVAPRVSWALVDEGARRAFNLREIAAG